MKEFITVGAKLAKDEEKGIERVGGARSSGSVWKILLSLFGLYLAGMETK